MDEADRDGALVSARAGLSGWIHGSLTAFKEGAAVVLALAGLLTAIEGLYQPRDQYFAIGVALLLSARGLVLGRPLLAGHAWTAMGLAVVSLAADTHAQAPLAWATCIAAGMVVWLPHRGPAPATLEDRRHVGYLVDCTEGDALAPFAMRTDKAYVFSPNRAAAVAYRVRFGTALAAGDPVGAAGSHRAAVEAFVQNAEAHGWRVAVLGVSERALPLWATDGRRAIAIGRESIIEVATFSLAGRQFRNLRQAVARTHNAEVTTDLIEERSADEALRAEFAAVLRSTGKAQQPRGFAMILDHPLDGTHPGTLVAYARDRDGRVVGVQRYATTDGGRELSLDVPWRRPDAPNGVDERLIIEVIRWGAEHGVRRVSLAFAGFPDLFAMPDRTWYHHAAYYAVRKFDRFIRLEALYVFLRKFHAFGPRRFVVFRPLDLLWVAAAALTLELGGAAPRRRWWRRVSGRGG